MNRRLLALASLVVVSGCFTPINQVFVDAGATCPTGTTACGASCVTLALDDANCGSCGHACDSTSACGGGACFAKNCPGSTCASTQVCVGDACVSRDCIGVTCAAGQTCFHGTCASTQCNGQACPAGNVCQANACVDVECVGVTCPESQSCHRGRCAPVSCIDGLQTAPETDVDCGGGSCPTCDNGKHCGIAADCKSARCAAGTCAPCAAAADCAAGQACAAGVCGRCTVGAQCRQNEVCRADGTCGACLATSECTGTDVCAAGTCRPCQSNLECPRATQVCVAGVCGACQSPAQCTAPLTCVSGACTTPCGNNQSCPLGLACLAGNCGTCTGATQCDVPQGCRPNGTCGVCGAAAECRTGEGCRADGGVCGACAAPVDCRPAEGCQLDAGVCGACRAATECRVGQGCHLDAGVCGSCQSATDCRAGEGCGAGGVCGTCRTGADCRAGEGCVAGTCGRCTATSQCAAGLTCNVSTGVCGTTTPVCTASVSVSPGTATTTSNYVASVGGNGTSCSWAVDGVAQGSVSCSGSVSLGSTFTAGNHSVEVTTSGPNGTCSQSASFAVLPTLTCTISRSSGTTLDDFTVNWSSDATTCSYSYDSGASMSLPCSGSSGSTGASLGGVGVHSWTGTAVGPAGNSTCVVSFNVTSVIPAPTCSVQVSPSSGTTATNFAFGWASDGTSCTWSLDGVPQGAVACNGTQNASSFTTGTHTVGMTCTGVGGTVSAPSISFSVSPQVSPPTCGVSVSPSTGGTGTTFGFTWASNGTTCSYTIDGVPQGAVPCSGTQTATNVGLGSHNVQETCVGPGGTSVSPAATFTVVAPPTCNVNISPGSGDGTTTFSVAWGSDGASCTYTIDGVPQGSVPCSGGQTGMFGPGSHSIGLSATGTGGTTNCTSNTITVN